MLPRIKKVEFGKVHINNDVVTEDFLLHAGGFEAVEKTNSIGDRDLDRMLLHDPHAVIFGAGFKGKMKVPDSIVAAAKKSGVDIHVLQTPDALKKFHELARDGKKVVAHIHVGE